MEGVVFVKGKNWGGLDVGGCAGVIWLMRCVIWVWGGVVLGASLV